MSFKSETVKQVNNLVGFVSALSLRVNNNYKEFKSLRDEIATNGVVRDLRAAEDQIAELEAYIDSRFNDLEHNGVATAINKLNDEVFKDKKDIERGPFDSAMAYSILGINRPDYKEPTLSGKVDAIIDHLGIDVSVQPEKNIPAKAVAVKKPVKKTTTRKRSK